jgi:putative transposase
VVRNLKQGGAVIKHKVVDALRDRYSIESLCKYLGISRSGYYKYRQRIDTDRDGECKVQIQAIYDEHDGTWGYRQIQLGLYRRFHIVVNHKRVLRLMQFMGLQAIIRRKRSHPSTYQKSVSDGRVAENLLERNFKADAPNQKWVTDVTQYKVGEQKIYLSAIKDLYNNEIVAHHLSFHNDNELVLETFRKAFKARKDVTGLIVHSDQGSQYTSHAYHDMLPQVSAQISMSRRGNCIDNASMESFFSFLKTEGLYPYDIRTLDEAQSRIIRYINYYNEERPQRKLKKLTPIEYRRQFSA